jgi:hypothetical protein
MSRRLLFAFASLVAAVATVGSVQAQTSTSSSGTTSSSGSGENIAYGTLNPERFLYENGVCATCSATDVTNTPRAQNLNPEGINYTDCEQNLRMDFTLVLSGFGMGDDAHVEVWAGTVDCTQDTNRVSGTGTIHACWQVAPSTAPITATSSDTIKISVYARDVLRYSAPPSSAVAAQPYSPSYNYSPEGEQACHVQTSDAAVPLSIYFLPVGPSETYIPTGYQYNLSADLVAPPPPYVSSLQSGDTLLTVNWASPGLDPDIVGFAVYSDPPAGGVTTGGCSCGGSVGGGANSYVGDGSSSYYDAPLSSQCMEASSADAETDAESDASGDGASVPDSPTLEAALAKATPEVNFDLPFAVGDADTDADPDAAVDEAGVAEASTEAGASGDGGDGGAPSDSGLVVPTDGGAVDSGTPCHPINMSGNSDGGASSCTDLLFSANSHVVNGSTTTTVVTADGSMEVVEASTTTPVVDVDGGVEEGGVTLSGGGISAIDPKYKAGEIDSITATSLTLTGLTNSVTYHVVVTTIDGSGNVGPISNMNCQAPGAVNDFWQTYKDDGGSASGCALDRNANAQTSSVFGLGVAAAGAAFVRRRRRR